MAFGDSGNGPSGTILVDPVDPGRPRPKKKKFEAKPVTGAQRQVPKPQNEPVLEWAKRTRAQGYFDTVDMFTSSTRYTAARQFVESKGSNFNLNPDEIARLIGQGVLSYGKVGDVGYRVPTVNVNVNALDQLLRDNYQGTAGGGYKRTDRSKKKGILEFSDAFYTKAAGSKRFWDAGRRDTQLNMPGANLVDAPKRSTPFGKDYDYGKMQQEFVKDEETYATFTGKIYEKIADEGGSGLLAQIQQNGPTEENLLALRQYMYSPRGIYGKAQEKWIDQTFFGGAGAEAIADATRKSLDDDQRLALFEDRVKEREALAKEQAEEIAKTNEQFFDNTPRSSWLNTAMSLIAAGTGNYVSTEVVNEILYADVQAGVYKDLTDDQKQVIYTGVLSAAQNGMPVPPLMLARAIAFEEELCEKGLLPDQVKQLEDAQASARLAFLTSEQTKAVSGIPVIGPTAVALGIAGGLTEQPVNEALESGPLSPTPLKEGFSLKELGINTLKAPIRETIALPQGLYYGLADPVETAKAMINDYKYRYGSLEGFADSTYENPLLPIMDVLTVFSGIGMATKGAQIARISAATKGGKIAARREIDMTAYNNQVDNWLNLPAEERATTPVLPPSAFEVEVGTFNARSYAALARKAANGDEAAAMILGELLPRSEFGLNSAYVPTIMDKAAAFFEPRYRIMTQQEGAPKRRTEIEQSTIDAIRETLPESPRAARIRFAGNPFARAIQKAVFYTQREVARQPGRVPQILSTLPGGYSFRFTRALREGDPAVLDLQAREMMFNRMMTEEFKALNPNDAEMMAIMNMASGEMYSPAVLRTIAFKRAERARRLGLDPNDDAVIGMVEADYKLFSDPNFIREYERAMSEMFGTNGVRSQRGEELIAAAERMILLREKTSHLMPHSWDDSRATRAMILRYQTMLEAADLMPAQIFDELGKKMDRIPTLNGVFHMYEARLADVLDLPNEAGVALRDTPNVNRADIDAVAKLVEDSLEIIRQDLGNRSQGRTPVFEVIEDIPNMLGDRGFVVVRRIRVDGEFDNTNGLISRNGLVDPNELVLPREFFVTTKKGGLKYWDNKKETDTGYTAAENKVLELTLNEMVDLYPNARDFSDKVSTENITGFESFADRKNFNKVVASGLMSFRYQEQIGAHAAAVRRRFKDDIGALINSQAEIIAINDFDPVLHTPLRTARVYATRQQAEAKIRTAGAREASIDEVTTPSGEQAFIANMDYFDVNAATLKEMRLRRILNWDDDVASNYFDDIEKIRAENPNQAIVVVPKYFARNVAKSYQRSNNLAMKILDSSTDMFKVLTLSLNPRFVPQQVIGSSVMLMLAYPDKAAPILSKVLEYSVRNAHKKIDKFTNGESAEFLNHNTDYMVMEQYMPRDVTESIFQQDMLATAEAKMPSKAIRYVLNSGYIIAFAWEKNLRIAVGRKMAMQYPGFKDFVNTRAVRDYAEGKVTYEGMAPSMFATNSPFAAAFKLKADPESPFYDPEFLREVRHGTDMVSGNYRDFTTFERQLRNVVMPFYAWTRHSALFTKRMAQERPLTTNALAWLGNYGYEKTLEHGGLPQWLLESLPMPQFLENILNLNPLADNRINLAGVSPVGTFGQTISAASNAAFGKQFGSSQATDFLNPYIKAAIEQQTGVSLLTGAPVDKGGVFATIIDGTQGYPVIGAILNLFRSESQLNALRGRENPEDWFVDAEDPTSRLSVPEDKLSTRFETDSYAGAYNLFSPLRAFSLDPEGLDKMIKDEFERSGVRMPDKKSVEYKGVFRTINAIQRWKRKRDLIEGVFVPAFERDHPEYVQRAREQLAAEFPEIPKSTPPGLVDRVLAGYVTLPGGG